LYAGAAPGNVRGFAQLNVMVPSDLEFGGNLPLEVQIGQAFSQTGVTIAVAGSAASRPGVPQSVTATTASAEIRVTWVAADTRALQFRIERRIAPLGTFSQIGVVGPAVRSFVDGSVVSGMQYEYRVAAENADGVSAFSLPASLLFSTQLPAPTEVRAVAVGPTQINLSWAIAGSALTGFHIERRLETADTFAALVLLNSGAARSFQDSGVAPATKYRYRLRALDGSGPSPYSEETSATTPAAAISAPALQATTVTASRIRLNWTSSAAGIVRFVLERRSSGGQYAEVTRLGAALRGFEDEGLAPSTAYTYRMRVETGSGVSPYSAEVSATTAAALPLAPSNLRTTATASTELSLTWTNNAPDATSIRLYMAESGAAAYTDLGPTQSLTSARVTNLRPGTSYFFLVRAQNAAGLSANSNVLTATTEAAPLPPATSADACMIFVHGSQEADENQGPQFDGSWNWMVGRNYWNSYKLAHFLSDIPMTNTSSDFVSTALRGSSRSAYVVRYNGSESYWSRGVAVRIAEEIIRATEGQPDGGNWRCARSFRSGGQFWVVAHSGGAQAMDFILGNAVPSAQHFSNSYQMASSRVSGVFSVGGAHRGSYLSDLACTMAGQIVFNCTKARLWMQTADAFQVSSFSSYPLKPVWLIGGSKGTFLGTSLLLQGEDDGVLSFASQYACGGRPLASYQNSDVCGNRAKMQNQNFLNLDTSYEDHDDERNNRALGNRERRAITDGIWSCSGRPCSPARLIKSDQSSAEFIGSLLNDRVLAPAQALPPSSPLPASAQLSTGSTAIQAEASFLRRAEEHYRDLARYPDSSGPIEATNDPLAAKLQVTPAKVTGPASAPAELSVHPEEIFVASPNPIVLHAHFSPAPNQVPPTSLLANIFGPDEQVIATTELRDNGLDGDAIAADGNFTATLRLPEPNENRLLGLHKVVVEAGVGPWAPLIATTYYHYGDPGARLTGRYIDQVVNGDLEIEAEVDIEENGRYHLEASLYSEAGEPIAWAENALELTPGRHRIPLRFHGLIFHEKGAKGPFLLKYVSLSNTTTFPGSKCRIVKDAYSTRPFDRSVFTNQPFNHPEMLREANRLSARPAIPGLR
jgi:titin